MKSAAKVPALGFICSVLLATCGNGGKDPGGPGSCANIAGTWGSTEIVDASACGNGSYTEQHTYLIAQTDCAITVTSAGANFSGVVDGRHLSWTGSYPADSGTTTIKKMDVVLSDDQRASGTVSWAWAGSGKSCSGTTRIAATKKGQASSKPAGVDAFCAKVVQCQAADEQTCESSATLILQGMIPDPDYFQTCMQNLQCSQLSDQTALQACVNLDNAATRCNGQSLHACARTGRCVDVSCSTACGDAGLSFDHCAFDPTKSHDVCFCRQ